MPRRERSFVLVQAEHVAVHALSNSPPLQLEHLEPRQLLTTADGSLISTLPTCGDPDQHSQDGPGRPGMRTSLRDLSFSPDSVPYSSGVPSFGSAHTPAGRPAVSASVTKGIAYGAAETMSVQLVTGQLASDPIYFDIASFGMDDPIYVSGFLNTEGLESGKLDYAFEVHFYDSSDQAMGTAEYFGSGSYVFQNRTDSVFGPGWWADDLEYLVEQTGGVAWIQRQGHGTWFEESGSSYTNPSGVFGTLTKDTTAGNEHFLWTDHRGNSARYENAPGTSRWLLAARIDANGNDQTYIYEDKDSDGFADDLTKITDVFGRETILAYHTAGPGLGKLESTTDFAGRVTDFNYNSEGQLESIEYPQVLDELDVPYRPTTTFEYTDEGLIEKIQNFEGDELEYTYDSETFRGVNVLNYDLSITQVHSILTQGWSNPLGTTLQNPAPGVAADNVQANHTSERGYAHQTGTNVFGQVNSITDGVGNAFTFTRDADGRVTDYAETVLVETTPGVLADQLSSTHYDYDACHNVTDITHADTSTVAIDYNAIGRPTRTEDEIGRVTLMEYDGAGGNGPNVLTQTHVMGVEDTAPGRPTGDPDDIVYQFEYTDGTTIYDNSGANPRALPAGLVLKAIDPLGRETVYTYQEDAAETDYGWLTSMTYAANSATDAATVQFEYDLAGNVEKSIDELNRETVYQYDALDRLVSITEPKPETTANHPVTTFKYDRNNNLRFRIDALQNQTEWQYDELNRVTAVIEADPDDPVGGGGPSGPLQSPITRYTYDASGNLRTEVDPLGRVTSWQYDAADRLIAVFGPDVDGVIEYPWSNPANPYDVNADGAVDSVDSADLAAFIAANSTLPTLLAGEIASLYGDVNADGAVDGVDQGALDAMLANPDPSLFTPDYTNLGGQPVTLYAYDSANNLVSVTDPQGNATEYRHDIRGRQTKVVVPEVLDATGTLVNPETTFTLDAASQLTHVTDPLGRVTEYRYDDLGRMVVEIGPDVDGVASSAWQNVLNPLDVDGDGSVTQVDADEVQDLLDNPPTSNPHYNPLPPHPETGEVHIALSGVPDLTNNEDEYFDVDGDGYVTPRDVGAVNDFLTAGTITDAQLLSGRPVTRYLYDDASNLTFIVDPMQSVTEFQYDDRDRLVAELLEQPTGPKSVPGTVTSDLVAARLVRPVTEYTFDAANRLQLVTDALGRVTDRDYDDLDRLTKLTLPDPDTGVGGDEVEFEYTYDLVGNRLTEIDGENNETVFDYDNLYRLHEVTQEQVDDGTGTGTFATPITTYHFDAASQLERMEDSLNRETERFYDGLGRLIKEVAPDPVSGQADENANSPVTVSTYDLVGNALTRTNALGHQQEWTYDSLYRTTQSIDETDKATTYTHDVVGNLLSLQDPESNTTTWTYDGLDRVDVETNQLSFTRNRSYDFVGNLVSEKDRLNRVTTLEYDHLYRNTQERWYVLRAELMSYFWPN